MLQIALKDYEWGCKKTSLANTLENQKSLKSIYIYVYIYYL